MKISDEYLVKKLLKKYGTYKMIAEKLGYSSYRPFRTALKKGLPETRIQIAMMRLLEDSNEEKK